MAQTETDEMESHFERIAIVSQGEAAIRLIQAVRELNLERQLNLSTVALFTEPERQAMFVREADDAVCIGPPTFLDPREGRRKSSYLDPERIEQAMTISQVDIAWVGWSPLAQEAWFADLCKRLGIVFVGPNAETLRLLGNKTSARQLAQQTNISVYSSEFLDRMHDGTHRIEVQVIADTFGTTWAVGVHDCTIQRHGQKLLEASRSQVLLPEQEHEVREAAVRLCQLANYQSAGSIEFLYDSVKREFWFLRFNSFLSAGYPLIEVTTGLDLVKLQLDLACGGHLVGEPPASTCHAIEIHLYPENMDKGLASRSGRLEMFRLANGPGIRIDTDYEEGDIVHAEFGPKLAQITAWGRDRQETLARLSRALSESRVVIRAGMSNKSLLLELLNLPELATGEVDTLWLDHLRSGEAQGSRKYASIALLQAAVEVYNAEQHLAEAEFYASAAHGRPRVRQSADFPTHFQYRGLVYKLKVSRLGPQQYHVTTSRQSIEIQVERLGVFERRLTCSGRRYHVLALTDGPDCYVEVEDIPYRITHEEGGLVRSPAPAVVVSVTATPGDHVNKGDRLAFIETMKIDMAITAPFSGTVVQVFVTSNVPVDMGVPLIHIEPSEWANTYTDTKPIQFVDAAGTARPNDETPRERCHRIFDALRYQILGYDIDPSDSKQLLSEQSAIYNLMAPDDHELLQDENEILSIFADICLLFRRELDPAESQAQEEQVHSAEHDLFAYLRSRDTRVERLPNTFLDNLQRALAHYDVKSLEPSPELDASLLLMYKSHEHVNQQLAAIIAILNRRLEHVDTLAPSASGVMHFLLDRLLLATQGRYLAVNDLAREIRFRYFNKPLFERARNKVYEEMQAHLAYLAEHPAAADREEQMSALVACPQPLQNLLTSRFPQSEDEMRQLMLEVLTRRYYRIRQLEDFERTTVDGQPFVKAAYNDEGRSVIVVTTFALYTNLFTATAAMSRFVSRFLDENDIIVDFYIWRSEPLSEDETTQQEILRVLDKTSFPSNICRIVVAVNAPGKGFGMASTQHFTYHAGDNRQDKSGGYEEDRLYRGLHPMMGERLHIWRLANFHIERLPSIEDVYLFHGIAIDNPKDERLFALAEVRDMSALRDESGKILQIPHLERMLMEALESIRLYQSHLPTHKRLSWNRVLLYVWPPLEQQPEEFLELMRKLWPATEGLGLERIVVHAQIAEPETGELLSRLLHVSNPNGRELVLRVSGPIETPIATLSEYRQKVVQLRQRGLVYPYEIIEMLTPEPVGIRTQVPPGNFVEYDLDEDNRLVPIDRPYGKNKAGIVAGVIRNYTPKYPEGMTRVILLGDPSHNLGSIAELECRRIIEAINLAERLQVPLEWFTFSAGARISMESGTENMDWVARTLRRIIEFTQAGGEINVIVNGINVGAQPYWNAEATMLLHTRGILIMTLDGAMVLTGKQSLDYAGGVSAEDNYGIGGYESIMGPNGQAQYFALDLGSACQILIRHYDHTYVLPGERFPRRAQTTDPVTRDVRDSPYFSTRPEDSDLTCVGDLFSEEKNSGRKHPFDIRTLMWALIDADHHPLERWHDMHGADTVVVWDAHLGGYPVAMLGIESRPIPRRGFIPADGPEQWTAGTLFPMSSKKAARAINSASGNRPLVVIANLSGFDGSPESLRNLQLEYGAEIGRAITNFKGPLIFCVVSRYHGGAFVDFSKALNENLETAAVEGSYASVIGGVPAAAVVFAREVDARMRDDPRIKELQEQLARATGIEKAALQIKLKEVTASVHAEKVGEIASEFDNIHTVQRAKDVGSIDHIISPAALRPYLIEAVERGIQRTQAILRQRTDIQTNQAT
jgi:acetyl/propionyl-CoA carboxylase alpha subunit/acetyl-CoA carboxylase carboxyltransferase component